MNFQQLRIIRETARCNFNLTEVANVLLTSQSGVSKHVKDFEDELGVELFVRRGKRLLGLTEAGKQAIEIVERMLIDAGNLSEIGSRLSAQDEGTLRIVTTHTQARYSLPPVIARFKQAFPNVRLALNQASPRDIAAILLEGETDIGLATDSMENTSGLATFPYITWEHARRRSCRTPASLPRSADAGRHRRVADHHLRRGPDRPHAHRRRVRARRRRARYRHLGARCRRDQILRRARPRRRHHRRDGVRHRAGYQAAPARGHRVYSRPTRRASACGAAATCAPTCTALSSCARRR